MQILVTGQGKSGTTALYEAIRQSLPDPTSYRAWFEPRHLERDQVEGNALVKTLIGFCNGDALDTFDKQILIVRDPRDNLISRMLYEVFNLEAVWSDDFRASCWAMAMWGKMVSPADYSVHAMIHTLERLARHPVFTNWFHQMQVAHRWHSSRPGALVVRYEDFVDGRWPALEAYLGFPITFNGEVEPHVQRVDRKREPGDWRNWFTDLDVEYYGQIYRPHMERYGYNGWELADTPTIEPEHSVDYIKRLVQERHAR